MHRNYMHKTDPSEGLENSIRFLKQSRCDLQKRSCPRNITNLGEEIVQRSLNREDIVSRPPEAQTELQGYLPKSTTMQKLSFSRFGAWIKIKIFIYNVTYGLYMLDWWERYLFNTIMILLLCVLCYNGSRFAVESLQRIIWYTSARSHEDKFICTRAIITVPVIENL